MSHTPKYSDDECSGPRPRVPGGESRITKMTEGAPECSKGSKRSYLNWAITLSNLLEDQDGVELFEKYVEEEAPQYNDYLKFYFACEGLKIRTDPKEIQDIIHAIYRMLRKSSISMSVELKTTIKNAKQNGITLSQNIYDPLQKSAEHTIREKIYPNFLRSDMYIQYIQQMSALHDRLEPCGSADSMQVGDVGQPYGTRSAGALYGPSVSASSSGSGSATDTLPKSSTLPTLHEDTELATCNEFDNLQLSGGMPMRLTRDLLLRTQARRLDVRPAGAHGYVYTATTSYNPNSRVDSERQSCSSGGRTDTESIGPGSSIDGRPYVDKRHSASECRAMKQNALANKEMNTAQHIPRTERFSSEHRPLTGEDLMKVLIPKLEELRRMQELETKFQTDPFSNQSNERALADAIRKRFPLDDDNDQDILDQHVSRVWNDLTPHRSPGTKSPCPPLPSRRRTTAHDPGVMFGADGASYLGTQPIRHSKSMPEHSSSSRKLTNKWPSMNTDSGISLVSSDLVKYKDSSYRSGSATQFEEIKRKPEDEVRRSRRYTQHQQATQLPTQSISSSSSAECSISTSLPPPPSLPTGPTEATTVVFTFCDEQVPYRIRIPNNQPTLKQFKDFLPKKGKFRYFFKTYCEDPDNPVIQEEIVNDSDVLPLFEGKVSGTVKPSD